MPRLDLQNAPSLDVLRLSANEVEKINTELDQQADRFQGNNRRQEERHPYRRTTKMVATVFHPGGTTTRYLIKPRNISRTGLAFLHGSFLHTGTRVIISLETLQNVMTNLMGEIVHCKFARGNVHEIGVRFVQPIEVSQFILEDQGDQGPGHGLPRLVGRVLFIEDEESDRQLLRFIFERLGVQVSMGLTLSDALEKLGGSTGFDLMMINVDAERDAVAALGRVRALSRDMPVIATTADENHPQRKQLSGAVCQGLLVKPLDAQAVAMTLLQHLPLATKTSGADAPPIYSTLWEDVSIRPLVLEYLDRLTQQVEQLRACVENSSDAHQIGRLCLAIKGTAGSYGFPQISDAAQSLRRAVNAAQPTQVQEQFRELVSLCHAAGRARHDQAA